MRVRKREFNGEGVSREREKEREREREKERERERERDSKKWVGIARKILKLRDVKVSGEGMGEGMRER